MPGHQQPVHAPVQCTQHPCCDDTEATTRCRVLPRRGCRLCSHCITTCTQLSSCRCSAAEMHCTSKQREVRTRSPECTTAAREMSPTTGIVIKHAGVQKHHGFWSPQVTPTVVWCDLTAISSAVCSTERRSFSKETSGSWQALAAATCRDCCQ
jgi:hypothetical protein